MGGEQECSYGGRGFFTGNIKHFGGGVVAEAGHRLDFVVGNHEQFDVRSNQGLADRREVDLPEGTVERALREG